MWHATACCVLLLAAMRPAAVCGTRPVINLSPYATVEVAGSPTFGEFSTAAEALDGYGTTSMILAAATMSLTATWKAPANFTSLLIAWESRPEQWTVSSKSGASWVPVSLKCSFETSFSASPRTPNPVFGGSIRPELGLSSAGTFVECEFLSPVATHQFKFDGVSG